MLPGSVAVVIDCQTDSKARTLQDLRLVIKKHGGSTTPISYLFHRRGRTVLDNDDRHLTADDVLEDAIEAGAEDVETSTEGSIVVGQAASSMACQLI